MCFRITRVPPPGRTAGITSSAAHGKLPRPTSHRVWSQPEDRSHAGGLGHLRGRLRNSRLGTRLLRRALATASDGALLIASGNRSLGLRVWEDIARPSANRCSTLSVVLRSSSRNVQMLGVRSERGKAKEAEVLGSMAGALPATLCTLARRSPGRPDRCRRAGRGGPGSSQGRGLAEGLRGATTSGKRKVTSPSSHGSRLASRRSTVTASPGGRLPTEIVKTSCRSLFGRGGPVPGAERLGVGSLGDAALHERALHPAAVDRHREVRDRSARGSGKM